MDKQQQQPPFENNPRSQENEDKLQRFVSKLKFTPVYSSNQPENVQQPVQPQHQYQNESQNDTFELSQGTQKQSNVRHIPIYGEGRSEPLYLKNIEQIFNENNGASLKKRAFLNPAPFAQYHSFHDHNTAQCRQTPPSQQQRQQTLLQESRSTPPPPYCEQVKPINALEKVQNVQAEVDELATAVNQFTGSLCTDKQFIYLDEMLTRNLIKLDTIETEGKDDVRIARKRAIKIIQDTISILENKVSQPQEKIVKTENLTENLAEDILKVRLQKQNK